MRKRLKTLFFVVIGLAVLLIFFLNYISSSGNNSDSTPPNEWLMLRQYLNNTAWDGTAFSTIRGLNMANFSTGGNVRSSPAVANGYVYITSYDNQTYQLNASNVSQKIANFTTPYNGVASPMTAGGYVYIESVDGNIYQLNASNVSQKISNFSTGGTPHTTPAVWNGYLYFGDYGGANQFYQLNASNVSQKIANFTACWFDGSPAVANGYVYIGGTNSQVYQLNASNVSQKIANFTAGGSLVSSASVWNGFVYIGSNDNQTYQLNASNVSQKIANFTTFNAVRSSPAVANGYVYIGSYDYQVYQLNASNISLLIANFSTGGIVSSSPAVAYGYVYVGSLDHQVYQLNASNVSQKIANFSTGSIIDYSSPAVANGYVYIGSYDYQVYQLNATNISLPNLFGGEDYNLSFVAPTPDNNSTSKSVEINFSITNISYLTSLNFNWNGTNYTMFNNSLVLMLNLDNDSSLGENDTYVADLSEYGNNGTVVGPKWNPSGRYGGGYEFSGVSSKYITVPVSPSLNISGEMTVAAWVYPKALPVNGGEIMGTYRWNADLTVQRGWTFGTENGPSDLINFKVWNASGNVTGSGAISNFFSNNLNKWTYVVGVYKPSTYMRLYVNGVLIAENTWQILPNIAYDPTLSLRIGLRADDVNSGMWNGTIDEVRIWNRSLSTQEIQEQYISNLKKYDAGNWSLYVNQTQLINGTRISNGNYSYYASIKDSLGREGISETRNVLLGSAVSYSNFVNNGQNVGYGDNVSFNITLSDLVALSGYTVGCDFSGNDSYVNISGTSYNLGFTKTANLGEGATGCCYVWFNDSFGSSNQTLNSCFNMQLRTKINVNYNLIDHQINNLIFGEGTEMGGSAMISALNSTGYNMTFFPYSKSMGFTNLRFGGTDCESKGSLPAAYNWMDYINDNTSSNNYYRWRNYSIDLTGKEPIFCAKISDSYNVSNSVAWLNDSIQHGFNITYWELGNENNGQPCNGTINATCYALRAIDTCTQMKAIKPDIKCGLVLASYDGETHNGQNWNNVVLSIAGNYTDFVIPHFYAPSRSFDVKYLTSTSPQTYNFSVNGGANYSVRINAMSDACSEVSDPYPDVQISVDGIQQLQMNVTTNSSYGVYNTPYNLSLSSGMHNVTINMPDDYYNSSSGCDKNLFVANLSISNPNETVFVPWWDARDWAYSALGASDSYIQNYLNLIKSDISNLTNHSMDIAVTEYNWLYDERKVFNINDEYRWEIGLFEGLMLNAWLQNNITMADIWSNLPSPYGSSPISYMGADGTLYPTYYVINLYSSKTGNYFVNYTIQDANKYNSSTSINSISSPNVSNEPFLSVAPSKDTVNKKYYIAVVNRNQEDDELVQINMSDDSSLALTTPITVTTLRGTNLSSHPYIDGVPIAPVSSSIPEAMLFNYTIPKYSIVFFEAGYASAPVTPPGGGGPGGGGGGAGASSVFSPTQEQMLAGYEKNLSKSWKINFGLDGLNYTLTLNNITNATAAFSLTGFNPISFNLSYNETKKFNLNNDNYNDFQVFLKNISNTNADLIIQTINEQINSPGTGENIAPTPVTEAVPVRGYIILGVVCLILVSLITLISIKLLKMVNKQREQP